VDWWPAEAQIIFFEALETTTQIRSSAERALGEGCDRISQDLADSEDCLFGPSCDILLPFVYEAQDAIKLEGGPEMVVGLIQHLASLSFGDWIEIDSTEERFLYDTSGIFKFDAAADEVLFHALKEAKSEMLEEPPADGSMTDPDRELCWDIRMGNIQTIFDDINAQRKVFYTGDAAHNRESRFLYEDADSGPFSAEDVCLTKSYHLLWSWLQSKNKVTK